MPWRYAADSVNEGHLINFAQCCRADPYFGQPTLSQSDHTLVTCHALDLGGRPTIDDHLPDAVGKIQQLTDGRAPMVARAGTLQASGAFTDLRMVKVFKLKARFFQIFRRQLLGALAIGADDAHQ